MTAAEGEPVVVGAAEMLVTVGANRTVESVETVPHRDGIHQLVERKVAPTCAARSDRAPG